MTIKQKYGTKALIAGASEGIGEAFARRLASEGIDLFLVARRREGLEKLAAELIRDFGVRVQCIPCDLSERDAIQQIKTVIQNHEIDILVCNAALSYIGPFEDSSKENNTKMAHTNMISPMDLTNEFGLPMLKRGRGAIVLLSSLAGMQGSGFLTVYSATKAFNRIFAESLWYEWKDRGVDVIACCAGATATPGYLNTNPAKTTLIGPEVQSPDAVVRECFDALGSKPSVTTGFGNRLASFFMHRIFPRKMAIQIISSTTKKMYRL